SPRVLVLGDAILDEYVWGDAERVSQEAPVMLLREESREFRLGGAANVAQMIAGLGGEPVLAAVVGDDAEASEVLETLEIAGVAAGGIVHDPLRPTTLKRRFLGRAQNRHPHQILRVDRETRDAVDGEIAGALIDIATAEIPACDAVLISDYAKGVCTDEVVSAVVQVARAAGLPVIADPSGSGRCDAFKYATAVTPNRAETGKAVGRPVTSAEEAFAAGRELVEKHGLDHAFVTLDSDGIAVVRADGTETLHPTRRRTVYDITGAGDMVLATIGVGAACGLGPDDLARLANVAGGLEVEQVGCVPITRDQIVADLAGGKPASKQTPATGRVVTDLDELALIVRARQEAGEKVVFTNGCFDLLHAGHVGYLEEAAALGDRLVVGVNSDASVRTLNKGPERPIVAESQRASLLAALKAVDYAIVFDEETPHRLLEALRPDVLVKGGTYTPEQIVGREVVLAYGGEVKALGVTEGLSTTAIVEKVRDKKPTSTSGTTKPRLYDPSRAA
ncbi:MAG: D-glycero-beta-D-manno-heptose 1-phosphate adenylyltransferase, partial [Planctomycetota bacterium]